MQLLVSQPWCSTAEAIATLMRRMLMRTKAPIFSSCRRIVSQVAWANWVWARPSRRSTLDSWSRRRRVIGKAEALPLGDNPRFILTSLAPAEAEARFLYERLYCARGDMENRIKECQLDLFADRTSAKSMRANQLRLWFASMAYVLICALRRLGLAHT